MEELALSDITKGLPGVSTIEGTNLFENCIVALHKCNHPSPVTLSVDGMTRHDYTLNWDDNYNDQLARTYADEQSMTERAAIAISILLALKQTSYTVIERSRKGTGFDYMLGEKDDPFFNPKARLEISGILRESPQNSVNSRYQQKEKQTSISDDMQLPAYISIVEFNTPKALFNIKIKTK